MPLEPVERVFELVEDGEFDEAIGIVDGQLARDGSFARLHALRAFLLVSTQRPTEASTSVDRALALDANDSYVQHAAAEVALAMSEPADAITAAQRAHSLDPDDDDAILLEARARLMLGQWDAVISRTDYILAGDSQNEPAAVLRAIALESKSGKRAPIGAADWADLSKRFPLNPFMRAGYAWTLLTAGRSGAAGEEFRQALAIDPTSAWAKQGLLIALKAKYPGYGVLLRYFFWMQTLAPRTRTLLAIAGVLGYNFLRRMGNANPAIKPLVTPILVAYAVFVLASWLADPLLNLALMWHKEGRAVLSEDDRRSGALVGLCLGASLVLALIGFATPWDDAFVGAMIVGLASVTIAGAYSCPPGTYRTRLLFAASVFVVLGLAAAVVADPLAGRFLLTALLGIVASAWLARSWSERSANQA